MHAGETVALDVTGRGGVPGTGVASVVSNVTMVNPSGAGFVTVYPCRTGAPPLASSINAPARSGAVANEVIAKLGTGGQVCLFSSVDTDLLLDVTGWMPTGSALTSLAPARLLESRQAGQTVDSRFELSRRLRPGVPVELDVLARGGVPSDGVGAVVLNTTMINPSGRGFVAVYPCRAGAPPLASSLNAPNFGGAIANEVIAKLGTSNQVCVLSSVDTDLAIDVTGWLPTTSGLTSLDPARILDSRPGGQTVDRQSEPGRLVRAGETVELPVLGRGGVPQSGVTAVVLNTTMVKPAGAGFVTIFPCSTSGVPLASSMNAPKFGGTVANEVIVRLGDDDRVCLFSSVATDLLVDVTGWIAD